MVSKHLRCGLTCKPLTLSIVTTECELHFGCAQPDFIKWSHDLGIQMQAYSPLASAGAPETQDPFIQKMAAKYDTKPANILISWQVARGVCPLPKSVTPERIRSNLELIDLKKEDVEAIEKEAASRPQQRLVPGGWGGVDVSVVCSSFFRLAH